jgi:serine/threonine protein kinase
MLNPNPDLRPSAVECLQHAYFVSEASSDSDLGFDLDSDVENVNENEETEGGNLYKNMQDFKERIKAKFLEDSKNSLHFKIQPTMMGATNTYGSGNTNSPKSILANNDLSINSPGVAPKKLRTLASGFKATVEQHQGIYKYALTRGTTLGSEKSKPEHPRKKSDEVTGENFLSEFKNVQKSKFA